MVFISTSHHCSVCVGVSVCVCVCACMGVCESDGMVETVQVCVGLIVTVHKIRQSSSLVSTEFSTSSLILLTLIDVDVVVDKTIRRRNIWSDDFCTKGSFLCS